jgi:soluble lytic murein transglycosylase-like protein
MALIYENKVPASYRVAFVEKVKKISANLGIDPNWLMAIMYFESAGTFSPSITNNIGATGLIQFIPSTAKGLGTSTSALKSMSALQQLDYVEKYLKTYKGKYKSLMYISQFSFL